MPRLFIALRVDPTPVLQRVLGRMQDVRGIAPVAAPNLHYTLRFLGNVDESIKQALLVVLREAQVEVRPFSIPIRGTSAFPDARRPRVVWAGCADEAKAPLTEVARGVDAFAHECGLGPRDKPFVAHLTLARIKVKGGRGMETAASIVAEERNTDYGNVPAARVHLVESHLTPQGPRYTDLVEVRLA